MPLTFAANDRITRPVKIWLLIGVVLVFVQVVLGGITRLTGSGLSITRWEIVTGTLPPLNAAQWEEAFELYRQTPQYEKINQGMSMRQFVFIYFWEYFHRLWARSMGFIFLFPFLYFLWKGRLSRMLIKDLGIVILLAMVVASVGWIMVASGLINRPWVNAYKLTLHLCLALVLFGWLLWTTFKALWPKRPVINNSMLVTGSRAFLIVLGIQIFLGGIMSGMKAGLFFPTWPDMNGEWVPASLLIASNWNVDNFVMYDQNSFMPAFIQFAHRTTAYLLTIMGLWLFFLSRKSPLNPVLRLANNVLITMLVIQATLGILTVLNCKGQVPLMWGVLHQAGALLLLGVALYQVYFTPGKSY